MAFFVQTPRQPSLGELLGQGISQGMQTGMQQQSQLRQALALQQAKQQAAMETPMTAYQQMQTALRAKELGLKEERETERMKEWEYTQQKGFKEDIAKNYQEALETDMRLNRMKTLNETGKLTSPAAAIVLDKLGLPVSILNNPDSEEFDKLSKDMLKNIRTYFGARINVVEVENFLKTIPTLMNSREGRDRVINNLKLLLEPRKMMYEEYQNLKKEYKRKKKRLPLDLKEKVLNRIKPKLDNLANTFEGGISQEVGPNIAPQTREFEKMPAPKDYSGAIIEDDKGNRYKSDGIRWRKI